MGTDTRMLIGYNDKVSMHPLYTWKYIRIMNIFLLTFLSLNKLYILKNDSLKAWNMITLKPLNPNVSLECDTMKRKLFPTDDKLIETIKSDAFKQILQTDASTEDGQKYVANYYGVTKQWEQFIAKDTECTNTASTYYQLLRTVKSYI
jgi:hypothetical protein